MSNSYPESQVCAPGVASLIGAQGRLVVSMSNRYQYF